MANGLLPVDQLSSTKSHYGDKACLAQARGSHLLSCPFASPESASWSPIFDLWSLGQLDRLLRPCKGFTVMLVRGVYTLRQMWKLLNCW